MLLGSGELGKEIALSAQRLGVEVVAVDRYDNAPAMQVAHRSHVLDMTDGKKLLALVRKERPAIIVPEIEAIATETLVEIENSGLADVIPNARAVALTMNREGIRKLAAEELGLPTSRYGFASNFAELKTLADDHVGYPCIVKPVMSSSGKGQSRVDDPAKLMDAWEYAQAAGRVKNARVIIESVVEFDYEITILTVRAWGADNRMDTLLCDPIGHLQIHGDYVESWQPQPMSQKAFARANDIARRITDALGGRGIFGVEIFVKGDDVWFSEVSPRPHDTGMVTMATQAQSEFDLHVRAILGLPVGTRPRRAGASAVIYGNVEAEGIAYSGIAEALRIPETQVRLFGKPVSYPRRRMGVMLACGDTIEIARKRAKESAARIRPFKP
jgi:phosphoribosylglycinamide formyltransferase 2